MNKAKTFLKTSLSALVEINAPNKEPMTRPENILRKLFHKIVLFFKCTLIAESELITIMLLNLTVLLLTISLISGFFYFKSDVYSQNFFLNNKILEVLKIILSSKSFLIFISIIYYSLIIKNNRRFIALN